MSRNPSVYGLGGFRCKKVQVGLVRAIVQGHQLDRSSLSVRWARDAIEWDFSLRLLPSPWVNSGSVFFFFLSFVIIPVKLDNKN